MATKIVTKNSSTASAVPTSSDLVQGELAVNVADKRLFTEDNAGAIVELGTNPTTLNVNGTATMDGLVVDGGAISTGDFTGTAAGSVRISGNGTTLGTTSFDLIQNSSGAYVYHRENLPLIFGTNDTERMRIDSSGNLLVGTSGTLYGTAGRGVLEVNGSSSSIAALKVNNAAAGYMYHSGTNMDVWNNLSGYLRFATSGAERMRIDASGILSFSETSSASFPARSINAYNNGYTYLTGGVNGLILKDAGMSGSRVQINATTMQFETNGAERMRIDSDGRALYGTTDTTLYSNTSGNGALINGGGGEMQIACNNSAPMWLNRMGNDGEIIKLYKAGATVGSIGVQGSRPYFGNSINFSIKCDDFGGGGLVPANQSGTPTNNVSDIGGPSAVWNDLYLGGGVYLGGTGSANKLDDYEEGTWTPTVRGGTAGYQVQTGRYTKIGNIVRLRCAVKLNSWSGTHTVDVAGLPFNSVDAAYDHDWGACNIEGKPNNSIWVAGASGATVFFRRQDITNSDTPMAHTDIDANTGIMFTVVYQTNE